MEATTPNAPPPRRKEMDIHMFVECDHDGNKQTKRSKTTLMIYMDM